MCLDLQHRAQDDIPESSTDQKPPAILTVARRSPNAIHSVHSSIRRQDIRLKVDRQPFED